MTKSILIAIFFGASFFTSAQLLAQKTEDEPNFFTGLSPVILERNAAEINFINNLSSFWIVTKQYRPDIATGFLVDRKRFTTTEHILRASYGFSKNKRWDLGAEVKFAQARLDDGARSSPFRVFGNETVDGISYRNLSAIGLRVRTMPFIKVPELTLQGTVYFPQKSFKSTEIELAELDAQNVKTGLTATYYLQSGANIYFFFQGDWLTSLKSTEDNRTKHSPAISSTMVIKTGGGQLFIFGGLNYGMTLQQFSDGGLYSLSKALFGSAGLFYQPTPKFSIVLSSQLPLLYESNLRYIEFVRESYLGFSLGMRSLL